MTEEDNNNTQEPATLILADGTRIDVNTGEAVSDVIPRGAGGTVLNTERVIREVTQIKRKIADLPEPPENMHIVALVLVYKLYGLDDNEVGYITGLLPAQVRNIVMSDTYTILNQAIIESIVEEEGADIRTYIAAHARQAATKMSDLMQSDNESVSLAAAKDLLDRAGHRPVDVVEHRIKREDRLEIIMRKPVEESNRPVIEATKFLGDK